MRSETVGRVADALGTSQASSDALFDAASHTKLLFKKVNLER